MPDPDLEMGKKGGLVIQTLRKEGRSPKTFFWALRASVWSKNKGRAPGPLRRIRHDTV